jgi:hypothetical protein
VRVPTPTDFIIAPVAEKSTIGTRPSQFFAVVLALFGGNQRLMRTPTASPATVRPERPGRVYNGRAVVWEPLGD